MNDLHIMLDLETLGTGRDAAVISIGAVRFNPVSGEILDRFYTNVTVASNKTLGRDIDPNTIEWWLRQDKPAQDALLAEPRVHLSQAAGQLLTWMLSLASDIKEFRKHARLWSNGPTFDEVIIRDVFAQLDLSFPVSYRGSRCMRTMIELGRAAGLQKPEVAGVRHNALDDAIHQAEGVARVMRELQIAEVPSS